MEFQHVDVSKGGSVTKINSRPQGLSLIRKYIYYMAVKKNSPLALKFGFFVRLCFFKVSDSPSSKASVLQKRYG